MCAEHDLEKPHKTIIGISAATQSKMNLCLKKSLKSCDPELFNPRLRGFFFTDLQ